MTSKAPMNGRLPIKPKPEKPLSRYTATELRLKFVAEYTCWRNSKSRAKENWLPEFADFRSFLTHMGPMPGKGFTLDRIDNDDPRYGPDLCRWADKRQQAGNRSTTHKLNVGESTPRPLPEVAREMGKTPAALRASLRGTDDVRFGADPREYAPWPKSSDGRRQRAWERRYLRSGYVQSMTRFEFLVWELERNREEARRFLDLNFDPDADEQDEDVNYYLTTSSNAEAWLEEALKEKPLWEAAVTEYESVRFDKAKRRAPGYLKRGDG